MKIKWDTMQTGCLAHCLACSKCSINVILTTISILICGSKYIWQDSVQIGSKVQQAQYSCQAECFLIERQRWLVLSEMASLSQLAGRHGLVVKWWLNPQFCRPPFNGQNNSLYVVCEINNLLIFKCLKSIFAYI